MTIFAWLARIRHADIEAASYIDEMELYWKRVDSFEEEGLKEEIVSRVDVDVVANRIRSQPDSG